MIEGSPSRDGLHHAHVSCPSPPRVDVVLPDARPDPGDLGAGRRGHARPMTRAPFPFRLAAIDIDDTLVGPDKRVSEANAEAIAQLRAHGCRVVLASGREHESMCAFHDQLGLDDYVISSQGALAVHPHSGHELWHRPVPPSLASRIVADGRARGADVLLYTRDGIFAAPDSLWITGLRQPVDKTLRFQGGDLEALAAAGPLKVLWYGRAEAVARCAADAARHYGPTAEIVVTAPELVEFNAPDATKATAVAAVAQHYGIAQADVVAFGDGLNDVAMLRWAGCGIAVGHAMPEARAAADWVIDAGDPETALARGIRALLDGMAR